MAKGYKGVNFQKRDNVWTARGYLHNKQINIGSYQTEEEAIQAKKEWEKSVGWVHKSEMTDLDFFLKNCLEYKDGELYYTVHSQRVSKGDKFGYINDKGYLVERFNGKKVYLHRLIYQMFNGEIPKGMCIDHGDGNPLNNKIENLNLVTKAENNRNAKLNSTNKTGYNGVYNSGNPNLPYRAKLGRKNLGYFSCKHEAVKVVERYKTELGFSDRHGKEYIDGK